jgi:integrase
VLGDPVAGAGDDHGLHVVRGGPSPIPGAVEQGRLSGNPTDRSTAPSPSEARPPEMQAWTAPELGRFLGWADARAWDLATGWRLLAATGLRRSEALALRWRDFDLDAGRLAVRRSGGVVKTKGAGEHLVEGPTKTGRSRVVDLASGSVAVLAYRAARGLLALDLVRDSALVLGNLDGMHRHPEWYSRRFVEQVSERLGHANATITLTVYQHVHPGMGRQAADRFAALLRG